MKIFTAAALAASITLLAACAQSGHGHDHHDHDHGHAHHHKAAVTGGTVTFLCDNGLTVQVQNAGSGKVRVSVDGREAVMTQAPSGSGERYTASSGLWGSGGEWHQKGGQAHFAYTGLHGAKGQTACRQE